MKKSKMATVFALILSGSIVFSSCLGSFALFNKVKDWNMTITDNKFVNELVFFAFHIVPVYWISYAADVLVINSIEFWTGDNPVANVGEVKNVKGENGNYTVETLENGYSITKEGETTSLELIYNKENKSWNAVSEGQSYQLFEMNEDGTAKVTLPDGTTMDVTLDAQGLASLNQVAMGGMFALR